MCRSHDEWAVAERRDPSEQSMAKLHGLPPEPSTEEPPSLSPPEAHVPTLTINTTIFVRS
jgi:hypothetical protein